MNNRAVDERNADQAAYWNGPGGRHWTDRQVLQDQVLAPVSAVLFERAAIEVGERVLDIGCGCGDTTLEIARGVGPQGRVFGLDISAPMLARARERIPPGAPIDFIEADATTYAFVESSADMLFSRFGVMFFADPALSFANMRKGLRRGGRVAFACWREPRLNPWIMIPFQAVVQHVPRPPETGPEDPGAFAFAAEKRVRSILASAGFADVVLHPADLFLDIAVGRGLDAAVQGALEIGPASRALQDQPAVLVEAATRGIREALAPFQRGGAVALAGAIWIVTARNP